MTILVVVACTVSLVADEIKSVDGRVTEADILAVEWSGLKISKNGQQHALAWEKIDAAQAREMKRRVLLKDSTDRFTEKRTVTFRTPLAIGDEKVSLDLYAYKAARSSPVSYFIQIRRLAAGWKWLHYSETHTLVDGKAGPKGSGKCSSHVFDDGSISESVTIFLSQSEMDQVARAMKFEIRVGTQEMSLEREDVLKLAFLSDYAAEVLSKE